MSPDIRPDHPPQTETRWYFVERPKRNNRVPRGPFEKSWLNLIDTSWERLSIQAYNSLTRQPDAVLKPDLLTEDSKDDQFRFTIYDMTTQIVTIGLPVDIKSVFHYFEIGQKLRPTSTEAKSGQVPHRVSREELFQIFMAVLAKLELNPTRMMSESNIKKIKKIRRKSRAKGFGLETEIEQILRQADQAMPAIEEKVLATPEQEAKRDTETPILVVKPDSNMQRVIILGTNKKPEIEFRTRPPITDFETQEEIDRLMRKKPERGGPMMNVR